MKLTSKQMDKYFGHLEDHEYKHYNRSLGCFIYSKEHFKHELEKRNMLPVELAEDKVNQWEKDNPHNEYKLSKKARKIINHFKDVARGRGGMIVLGEYPKAVKEMEKLGISFKHDTPENFNEGGFNDA